MFGAVTGAAPVDSVVFSPADADASQYFPVFVEVKVAAHLTSLFRLDTHTHTHTHTLMTETSVYKHKP